MIYGGIIDLCLADHTIAFVHKVDADGLGLKVLSNYQIIASSQAKEFRVSVLNKCPQDATRKLWQLDVFIH